MSTNQVLLNSKNALQAAGNAILFGGVIVYPTDTLYGFGVDARNENAIKRLNAIKGRTGPMSVIAPDVNTVLNWTNISYQDWEMVKKFLRGPTTIILPVKKGIVHSSILGKDGTLGIRIPSHSFGPELTSKLGFPITTTSVNKTYENPLNNPKDIIQKFDGEFDLLIDDGNLPKTKGSTIYKLEKSKLTIIRR
ncbi:MAG: threonylcarbamoyl-AMP synthase [Candidatus Marinimicrobia bacterium]|nr:threonylcarbamoyl-AMP synthase [Candidatus Neomarinimicrobiota bacterium]MBT3796236.1 threonylcarbamoyl-AMP synthase [Candidatus Neomarinimicrobiota bacterium]MBT5439917.1 threonylcarbamoyl-AMP synthase [Candidatus Neomarinimicrobiota bacterium]MDG2366278.1 L-threonylcarbamoyladenylate synthase [Candidatus Neomarinimicrobiota bacterium]